MWENGKEKNRKMQVNRGEMVGKDKRWANGSKSNFNVRK